MRNADSRGIYRRGETFWLNFQRKGKRVFVSLETSDFAEAIVRAREIRTRPELSISGRFLDEIDRFLAYKRRRNEFTASTAYGRTYILRHFATWIDAPVENVTSAQVQAFYDWKLTTCGVGTANSYAMILRSFFNWCVNTAQICRRSPVELELTRTDSKGYRLKDFLHENDRDRLIRTCEREDLKFVLFCGFHAGLRKNEIIEAPPWWFDLDAGLLHLRQTSAIKFKDRQERTIPLTQQFVSFLRDYGLRSPYMLSPGTKHGQSRYRYDFTKPFLEHVRAQGLERIGQTKVTPHLMRHTFASLLASNGVSLYKIARWLGDDPRIVEERYARLRPNDPDIERAFSQKITIHRLRHSI